MLPLVGYLRTAMVQAMSQADDEWLFPKYINEGHCYATYASNAVNKWLKKGFNGLTAHCLRHTFRDRLRAVECPSDLLDQIGGWSSSYSIGSSYGSGYRIHAKFVWLRRINLIRKKKKSG